MSMSCHGRTPYVGDNNERQQRQKQWLQVVTKLFMILREETKIQTHARPTQTHTRTHTDTLTCIHTYTAHVLVCSRRTHDGALCKVLLPMGSSPNRGARDQSGGFWIRGSGRIRDFGDGPTTTAMTTRIELSPKALRVLPFFKRASTSHSALVFSAPHGEGSVSHFITRK
ncbi:hypothetical protein CI102_5273 [Trichoderma harzianum]|uniref:Uncharacterized protein n=1 Tax=Trichoderma harzianum CBS 226.95 TaxID=983964 RepID=A0A2T4AUS9_TRIHA|nr:hypothetical protein M431DRAFT_197365 [Trichoderma harzianum CBS 226.95]PKK51885.1 hypothetical protein CI102_5273 [Trichoderma harzianum]PTB60823.1 hypothetical protein M431DRAFT_197365 [Trichoderma harzianum CBS 226.95]